jgi:PAS domain S-box-containing protein
MSNSDTQRFERLNEAVIEPAPVTANVADKPSGAPILQSFQSDALLRLIDQVEDALIIRDLEDCICFWSKGAERLYGWRYDEVAGHNVYDVLFAGQVEDLKKQQSSLAETGVWKGELSQETKAHRKIVVESHWVLQRDESGRPIAVLIANRDITEKKELEHAILRAQRIETIGRLASGVAHDLNTALSMMLMSMRRLLEEHIELRHQYDLESWQFSAKHAARLIAELLSLGKEIDEKPVSIDIRRLVVDTARVLKSTFPQTIKINTVIPADLHPVCGNITHLYQVLLNLCLNARDAMPSGGTLKIEASNVTLDETAVRRLPEAKPGTYVLINVADTGIGMSHEITSKIFDAFYTTKQLGKGTGLGLFTVGRIVKNHGGHISVMTEPGQGTQFIVYLPTEKAYSGRSVTLLTA